MIVARRFSIKIMLMMLAMAGILSYSTTKMVDAHMNFAPLVQKLLPTVVNIVAKGKGFASGGSGVIIDSSGYIVTNHHVIDKALEITVVFQNEERYDAKLIGSDSKIDIALLKIKSSKPLPHAEWGDSDTAQAGDWVLAIGNPYGLGGTVTAGIVSARSREMSDQLYNDYIQTDAAINSGNSGGPMFNASGQVIGINTMIYSETGGNVGLGFAVPSNVAKAIVAQLKRYGRTKRGWLGVSIQAVTKDFARSSGLGKVRGVLVSHVVKNSPAQRAGLRQYDVILSYNGKSINHTRELPRMVADTPIHKSIPVVIWRDGRKKTLYVRIGELKTSSAMISNSSLDFASETATHIEEMGVFVVEKTRQYVDSGFARTGMDVTISHVEASTIAAKAGLMEGDVVIAVNQYHVEKIDDLQKMIKKTKLLNHRMITFFIRRGGRILQVTARL